VKEETILQFLPFRMHWNAKKPQSFSRHHQGPHTSLLCQELYVKEDTDAGAIASLTPARWGRCLFWPGDDVLPAPGFPIVSENKSGSRRCCAEDVTDDITVLRTLIRTMAE
jgi:hypothetical protein